MFNMTKETEKFLDDAADDNKKHRLLLDFTKSKLSYTEQSLTVIIQASSSM